MAAVKHEPLDIDERTGVALAIRAVGGASANSILMMESSTASPCLIRRDVITDNDGGKMIEHEHHTTKVNVDEKLEIMHTEDPLLQETINALMNGTGGIEVVSGTGVSDEIESERNYECNFCGKLFTRSNTLSYHLKVHNDEKPFKCSSCDKAFREQYRLTKHQRTHVKDASGNIQQDQEAEHSQDSSFPSTSGRTAEEEDYTTGDSERFFKNYELQDSSAAMKLEPDISLTVDGTSTNPPTQSSTSDNDVRYQIIEERIKSLQREVHLVNQNLNRVECKLDGLTKIIAIFINKFDDVEQQATATSQNNNNNNNGMIPVSMLTVPIDNLPTIQQHTQQPAVPVQIQTAPPQQSIQMVAHHNPAPIVTVPVQAAPAPIVQSRDNNTINGAVTSSNVFLGTTVTNSTTIHTTTNNDTFPEVPELPIRTVNDFLDLNDHCTDNEQFLLQMMIRLHQEIDSSQPHQRNVKKMMEALVTYEVLCQFSWSGKSAINGQYTKYVFGNSVGIIDLVTKTLNLGKTDQEAEANRKPIFTAIQSFIKHSRQNMLRDSRKRRESNGVFPPALSSAVERQIKLVKADNQF